MMKSFVTVLSPSSDMVPVKLPSVVTLLEKSFACTSEKKTRQQNQVPMLAMALLKSLINRFTKPGVWMPTLHQRSVVQALLSTVHHSVRHRQDPDLIQDTLGLLMTIAKQR